ncbi:hypothetical protein [Hyphomicrobium sp.]|uniref:hypothetical protein n=1 Tax=Hyphomicrobium sp. TaxID=82 RepID=UPI001DABAAE4|nr:hypothetical protein [Hyphomicrobium sp.]MBY0558848.1 hypothetical protein [Hyphomicrobium sp.]
MSEATNRPRKVLEVDFSAEDRPDLNEVDFRGLDLVIVHIPLPSFGSSNSHIDLCSDLLDASWALEKLATDAERIETTVGDGYFKPNIIAKLHQPRSSMHATLVDCALVFMDYDVDPSETGRLQDLRGQIADYEDMLPTLVPAVPDIVDQYLANLMAANGEFQSEAPDFYEDQMRAFPECRVGYFKSAYSSRIGGDCYASHDGWVIDAAIEVDDFFARSGQHFRLNDFRQGELFMLSGGAFVCSERQVIEFPSTQYLRSLVCASVVHSKDEDHYLSDLYCWLGDTTTPKGLRNEDGAWRQHFIAKRSAEYFVHETGSIVLVNDGRHRHFLYDTRYLNLFAVKAVRDGVAGLLDKLSAAAGLSDRLNLDWASLSDERFEELCYDVIYSDPNFDTNTIRKHGKSRSRDGGRDIEVHEVRRWQGGNPRKWIFQCKLVTNGSSLGATKLVDVGDMLDHYGAHGFGVMTSALIDATLYDKLDRVCDKRDVMQRHFSILELERAIARHPGIRKRYFL